jgi:hypothetical protein
LQNIKSNACYKGHTSSLKLRLKERIFILLSIFPVTLFALILGIMATDLFAPGENEIPDSRVLKQMNLENISLDEAEQNKITISRSENQVKDVSPPAPPSDSNREEPPNAIIQPESNPGIDSYFSDALFIGDSRTQGLMIYSGLTNATYYATKGLNIKDIFEKPTVSDGNTRKTVYQALGDHSFGKVYIMLGANELGWPYPEVFFKKYGELIDRIKETQPEAIIYAQSILPVSASKSNRDGIFNNTNINKFNASIEQISKEKGIIYLKVNEGISDENGNLPEEAATDGLHLTKEYCIKWEHYLRNNKYS